MNKVYNITSIILFSLNNFSFQELLTLKPQEVHFLFSRQFNKDRNQEIPVPSLFLRIISVVFWKSSICDGRVSSISIIFRTAPLHISKSSDLRRGSRVIGKWSWKCIGSWQRAPIQLYTASTERLTGKFLEIFPKVGCLTFTRTLSSPS